MEDRGGVWFLGTPFSILDSLFSALPFLVVSIKARGSIRAVSRKVFSFCFLALALISNAQTNGLFSAVPSSSARAKVVIVQDNAATDAFRPHPERVRTMVERGITNLMGKASASEAWMSLVSTQDTVGIKVFSEPGPNSGTRP